MEPQSVSTDEVAVGAQDTASANEVNTTPSVEIRDQTISYANTSTSNQQEVAQVPHENSIEFWRARQKPVKEKNLKVYKILAIVAIIAFFPCGIPALWQAFKLKEDFYNGIQKGDLTECNKRSQLLQKLLILAFTMCLFTVVLILIIVGGVDGRRSQTLYSSGSVHL